MAAQLTIKDGNPVWLSQAIKPSKQSVVPAGQTPTEVALSTSAKGVFVYVQVDNTGTEDLGVCTCAKTGIWGGGAQFQLRGADPPAPVTDSRGGVTFTITKVGDSLSGAASYQFGHPGSGKRAWGWSADGNFFAYASAASVAGPGISQDWSLTVVALRAIPGTTLKAGDQCGSASGVYPGPWTTANFAWLGTRSVISVGADSSTNWKWTLVCPLAAPGRRVAGAVEPTSAGQTDWRFVSSPCSGFVAFVPRRLNSAAPLRVIALRSTDDPTLTGVRFRVNNAPTEVQIVGINPSITTVAHTAKGVNIDTGAGAIATVDDPECTMVGGGITVRVDRVLASTLPAANMGVRGVGQSSAFSLRRNDPPIWAQVPAVDDWSNLGEEHWCLLAQAYTADPGAVPRPWNGQAANPPSFPVALVNCAQRNVAISSIS